MSRKEESLAEQMGEKKLRAPGSDRGQGGGGLRPKDIGGVEEVSPPSPFDNHLYLKALSPCLFPETS